MKKYIPQNVQRPLNSINSRVNWNENVMNVYMNKEIKKRKTKI